MAVSVYMIISWNAVAPIQSADEFPKLAKTQKAMVEEIRPHIPIPQVADPLLDQISSRKRN